MIFSKPFFSLLVLPAVAFATAFFCLTTSAESLASDSCSDSLETANAPVRQKISTLNAAGREGKWNADLVLDFYDSLLVSELKDSGFKDLIYNDLKFQKVKFGYFRRLSWYSSTLKLPPIKPGKLTQSDLADYVLVLAEYLIAAKASHLRLTKFRTAFNPVAFVRTIEPVAQRLHHAAYQIAGILDPTAIKQKIFDWNLLSATWFLFGFRAPPISLFRGSETKALDYLTDPATSSPAGMAWKARAGLHWGLSRMLILARVGLIGVNAYGFTEASVRLAPVTTAPVNYSQGIKAAVTPPADLRQENLEIIADLKDDLIAYRQQLPTVTDPDEKADLEFTIKSVELNIKTLESQVSRMTTPEGTLVPSSETIPR